jgi:hypothetical protein
MRAIPKELPKTEEDLATEIINNQPRVDLILEQAVLRLIRQGTISQFDLPDNSLSLLDRREDIFHKLGVLST